MIQQHRNALNFTLLPSFENWKAFTDKQESKYAYEIPLYTDATLGFRGKWRAGPYEFFRLASEAAGESPFKSILLMRVDVHARQDGFSMLADLERTNDTAYHGGNLDDEIAALLCLLLGIRLMPGTITREFSEGGDPRGTPAGSNVIPTLVVARSEAAIIPRLQHHVDLDKLPPLFNSYPALEKSSASMLVKAARQYQKAAWYADSDPNQAWLMLVSAIEAAARHRYPAPAPTKTYANGDTGVTNKFVQFVLQFSSGPPEKRPGAMGQFPFGDNSRLTKALKKIYHYRSQALHEGIPFPAPMCRLPGRYGGDDVIAEVPTGVASGMAGSSWKHEDTPMALHTFEHIVRNSLTAWWQSMAETKAIQASNGVEPK